MDKKILVTRSSMPPFEEYADEIKDMWDTHWLTNMGVKHKQLEKDLADYLGISKENIALFVNGHQAVSYTHLGVTYDSFYQMMYQAMRNIEMFDKGQLQEIEQSRYKF